MIQVLIVEDELDIGVLVKNLVNKAGMQAHHIDRGDEALKWIKQNEPDIVVLDLSLPGLSGENICRSVRRFSDIPIIMATAKVEEVDRLIGFELGANDYLCKPYSSKELIARIKNLLRIFYPEQRENQSNIYLEHKQLEVYLDDNRIHLSNVEYKLFSLLYNHPKRVYSREQIIDCIHDEQRDTSDRSVDSLVKKLRKKLKQLDTNHNFIQSVYGVGYRFDPLID